MGWGRARGAMSPTTTSTSASEEEEEEEARASSDAVDALVERVGALDVREAPKTDEGITGSKKFGHVLVLVGVDQDAKTRDVERALGSETFERGPKIVWVGKTRACAAFASEENAGESYARGAPKSLGASAALLRWEKGKKEVSDVNTSELAPPKARPRANASVARRMIANALNVKLDDAATRPSAEEKKAQSDARKKRAEEKRRERERLSCKGIE